MIQLITSDLDETLLNDDKHVGFFTAQKIKEVTERGIHFVCATGRPYFSIHNTLKEIGQFQKEGTYTISFNGACITENKQERVLFLQEMDRNLAEEIYQFGLAFDVCIHVYTDRAVYAYRLNDDERQFLKGRMEVIEIDHKDLNFLKNEKILKVLYENTDTDSLKTIEKRLPEHIQKNCDLSYSSNRYFEFNKLGIHKGIGLKFLCSYLGLDIQDTMAIGDNINDLGMLKQAFTSIGVFNSNPLVKDQVDHVVPYTNNEDAVGHILDEYILKK